MRRQHLIFSLKKSGWVFYREFLPGSAKVKPENHLRGAPGQPSEAGDDGVFLMAGQPTLPLHWMVFLVVMTFWEKDF